MTVELPRMYLSPTAEIPGESGGSKNLVQGTPHLHNSKRNKHRSEGFPNEIFEPCALWARGLAKKNSSRHAAARRHLEIQVDILARELYLEFVLMELGPGGSS